MIFSSVSADDMVEENITQMPDDISSQIISLLHAKDALSFGATSTAFHNLVTLLPDQTFDDSSRRSFEEFLNELHTHDKAFRLRKLSVTLRIVDETVSALLNQSVCDMLSRGLMHLVLINNDYEYRPSLPVQLFNSESIESLDIRGFRIDKVPRTASLPGLNRLVTHRVTFDENDLKVLLSSCPPLDYLVINGHRWRWPLNELTLDLGRQWDPTDLFDSYEEEEVEDIHALRGFNDLRRSFVQRINIHSFNRTETTLARVKHILASFPYLESLKVQYTLSEISTIKETMLAIQNLPRASASCIIKEI